MKKEMNNKGFSLVELIIVIAIMAVLVGILAPQYLKYVNNSKVSTDVTNAQEMATVINTAIADQAVPTQLTDFTATGATLTTLMGYTVGSVPVSKMGGTYSVTYNTTDGVKKITLAVSGTDYECYPNPDSTTANGANNKVTGSGTAKGLKK